VPRTQSERARSGGATWVVKIRFRDTQGERRWLLSVLRANRVAAL